MPRTSEAHAEQRASIMQAKNEQIEGLIRQIYEMAKLYDGQLIALRAENSRLRAIEAVAHVVLGIVLSNGHINDDDLEIARLYDALAEPPSPYETSRLPARRKRTLASGAQASC